MTLQELKEKIKAYQYFDNTDVIDVALASLLSNSLSLGMPVWMIIIGASSGGKTQMLRPLALTNPNFIHSVDNLTPNTLLSGANIGKGKEPSLLHRIGKKGVIMMSDLTVLFSNEEKYEILAALRTIYDGYYDRTVGNKGESLSWRGQLGIIAGCTPSIYSNFEEVNDLGERFVSYRMKEYNSIKATEMAMDREIFGDELNQKLSSYYKEYIKEIIDFCSSTDIPKLSPEIKRTIVRISQLAERVRTTAHTNWRGEMDRLPVSAYPMRVSQQLGSMARGLLAMRLAEGLELGSEDIKIINWCGWSLASEEKRACLHYLSEIAFENYIKTQTVADLVGLNTSIIQTILQNLSSIGLLKRSGDVNGLKWKIADRQDWELIREIEGITDSKVIETEREISAEEPEEVNARIQSILQQQD